MDLPIFKLTISDNEQDTNEVDFVSLVDKPAIQRNFLAFKERQAFAIQDEEQQIISGPAMIPDMPIFRNDENGQYYVVFDADTIHKIALRFFKKGYQANINAMHQRDAVVTDSVFYESWIVNRSQGKKPMKGFEDLPDGTWFLTAKINNPDTWAKIKAGQYRGFSVEGLFEYRPVAAVDPEQALLQKIGEIVKKVK